MKQFLFCGMFFNAIQNVALRLINNKLMEKLWIALKGMAMGMAEVVPGISGGTIAFITGIYERLLHVISSIRPSLWKNFRKDGLSGVWVAIDGVFITSLMLGMIVGIVIGVFGITWLLENYPVILWGFFFGLIFSSAIYVARQISTWTITEVILLALGTFIAVGITLMAPAEGSVNAIAIFFAGAIAVSALIMPGISGSFILLLMGMYTIVLPHVKDAIKGNVESIQITLIFLGGCVVGLFSIAHVLSWLFKHYRTRILALLTGFILGSLNKIWPWRNPSVWVDSEGNVITDKIIALASEARLIREVNVMPQQFDGEPFTIITTICIVFGFFLVLVLERIDTRTVAEQ